MSVIERVDELAAAYGGGEPYFAKLDAFVRQPSYFALVTKGAFKRFGEQLVVVSGDFGSVYREWSYSELGTIPFWMPGRLRHRDVPLPAAEGVNGKSYVFIDDSHYAGRTYDHVGSSIVRGGGRCVGAFVIYDGCPWTDSNVGSLFRWNNR